MSYPVTKKQAYLKGIQGCTCESNISDDRTFVCHSFLGGLFLVLHGDNLQDSLLVIASYISEILQSESRDLVYGIFQEESYQCLFPPYNNMFLFWHLPTMSARSNYRYTAMLMSGKQKNCIKYLLQVYFTGTNPWRHTNSLSLCSLLQRILGALTIFFRAIHWS